MSRYDNSLSVMETQILSCICRGMANKQIGSEIHLSDKTVKNHVSNLFVKARVQSRCELVVWAVNEGYYIPDRYAGLYRERGQDKSVLRILVINELIEHLGEMKLQLVTQDVVQDMQKCPL